jgi:two-component sensor histidine kinase
MVWVQGHRVSASSVPETLRAKAIELVDEHGRIRAQLNVESNGEAVLRLRDSSGEIRVKLGADKDGSGLLLLNGSTEPGVHMLAKNNGTTLTLTNKGGQRRVITP